MPTALVVSGGGCKGAFAVGVIDHLVNQLGVQFDFVAGTSTGALMAPLVVTGEIAKLIDVYTSVRTEDILRSRQLTQVLNANSIYDVNPLFDRLKDTISPARASTILNSPIQMVVATVCLQTSEVTYFATGPALNPVSGIPVIRIQNRIELIRAVLASADMPILMPPVQIPKPRGANPIRQYVDGGVREVAPLKIAIDNGATQIFAIVLSPESKPTDDEECRGLLSIAARTISTFIDDVVANDVKLAHLYTDSVKYWLEIKARLIGELGMTEAQAETFLAAPITQNPLSGKRAIALHVIRPLENLADNTLEFDPVAMASMMQKGRDRTKALLGP